MLHVFAIEDIAACFDRGSDDERIIECEAVVSGYGESARVGVQRDRDDVNKRNSKLLKSEFDLRPISAELSAGDMDELVQHLNTYIAAAGEAAGGLLFFGSDVAV